MRRLSAICDYFVIASATTARQVKAMADSVEEKLKQAGYRLWHTEGYPESLWVLLDCGDTVVHLFAQEMRSFYDLEHLWADAPRIIP